MWGTIRRHSTTANTQRIEHILGDVNLEYADLTDLSSLQNAIMRSQPHEIYNLAAQSHVKVSYENPILTSNITGLGVLNLLEAIKACAPHTRLYQAGTSEMFGNSIDEDGYQRETTPFKPANPYAIAKVFAHQSCINYRNSYKLFISNGILFNHESPRRGENFVTSKVVREAVKISLGLEEKLPLGVLSSCRDWGHAKDYTRAMWMILQHNKPDDFVCATGKTHSIKELCSYVFTKLNLDYKEYVVLDPRFARPQETRHLKGDSSKLRKALGWEPNYTFETMLDDMIEHYQNKLKSPRKENIDED